MGKEKQKQSYTEISFDSKEEAVEFLRDITVEQIKAERTIYKIAFSAIDTALSEYCQSKQPEEEEIALVENLQKVLELVHPLIYV